MSRTLKPRPAQEAFSLWLVRRAASALAAAVVCFSSITESLTAQDPLDATCPPIAVGVPWLTGAPNWWGDPRGAPWYNTRFDDPRWEGAAGHTDGSAANEHVDFRTLYADAVSAPDTLYLSWEVRVDRELNPIGASAVPTGSPLYGEYYGDAVWFGLQQQDGSAYVLKVGLDGATSTRADAASQVNVFRWQPTPQTWTLMTTTDADWPQWISQRGHVWIESIAGQSWGVQVAIPVDNAGPPAALRLGTEFKLWYALFVVLSAEYDATQPDLGLEWVTYQWPRGLSSTLAWNGDGIPAPATWSDFCFGICPDDGEPILRCAGDLSIASHVDIETGNSPESEIAFDANPETEIVNGETQLPDGVTRPRNTFHVRPTNRMTAPIDVGRITARLWIANWGSQPGWNEIPNKADLWREITDAAAPPSHTAALPVGLADDASRIGFEWEMPVCAWFNFLSEADYPTPMLSNWLSRHPEPGCDPTNRYAARKHQCVLAELSSRHEYTFLRRSYWRNMDFVTVPDLSRTAEITVRGLAPSEGDRPKKVYLYVQTFNMPRMVGGRAPKAARVLRHRYTRRAERSEKIAGRTMAIDTSLTEREMDSLFPTYRVHAYRETADSVMIGRVKRPVLKPQTSFGYWMGHDGEVVGWRNRLEGPQLVQVAPNFYRVEVPSDSSVTVTTRIKAIPPRPFALSLHGGVTLPHGTFSNAVDPGFAGTADLELRLSNALTAEALFGFHRFKGVAAGGDVDLRHISGGLKAFLTAGLTRLFVSAGGGTYTFDPGATDPGAHAGAGVQFNPSLRIALTVAYTAHTVFTSGSNTTLSSIQAGGRVRF